MAQGVGVSGIITITGVGGDGGLEETMEVAPQEEVNALFDGRHAISSFWKGRGKEESVNHQQTLPASDVIGCRQLSHWRHCPAIVAFA